MAGAGAVTGAGAGVFVLRMPRRLTIRGGDTLVTRSTAIEMVRPGEYFSPRHGCLLTQETRVQTPKCVWR